MNPKRKFSGLLDPGNWLVCRRRNGLTRKRPEKKMGFLRRSNIITNKKSRRANCRGIVAQTGVPKWFVTYKDDARSRRTNQSQPPFASRCWLNCVGRTALGNGLRPKFFLSKNRTRGENNRQGNPRQRDSNMCGAVLFLARLVFPTLVAQQRLPSDVPRHRFFDLVSYNWARADRIVLRLTKRATRQILC